MGLSISTGMISKLERRSALALAAPCRELAESVHRAEVVNVDETGWREQGRRAWLWAATTESATVFPIAANRSAEVARGLLGDKRGRTVGSDRFSAYNGIAAADRQLCWSHLRRDFQAMIDRGGVGAKFGVRLLGLSNRLFRLRRKARDGLLIEATYQKAMRGLERFVHEALSDGSRCGCRRTAATCSDLLRLEAGLWNFARRPGVEPTNNVSTRMRHAVIWRRISGGTASDAGSRFVERMLTAVATCRRQGRNVLDYLASAFQAHRAGLAVPSLLQSSSDAGSLSTSRPVRLQAVELRIDDALVFAGDVVDLDHQRSATGWVTLYQCRCLRARGERIPFTDSNTLTDSASWNPPPDDLLYLASRSGRTVGEILADALTMPTNAEELHALGIGGYTSLAPPTLPTATLADLAGLDTIPPQSATISGGKLLSAIDSYLSSTSPNHSLRVQADGVLRFLDLRTVTEHTLTMGIDSVEPVPLKRSVADCYQRVVVRGQPTAEPKLLTQRNGGIVEDFAWGRTEFGGEGGLDDRGLREGPGRPFGRHLLSHGHPQPRPDQQPVGPGVARRRVGSISPTRFPSPVLYRCHGRRPARHAKGRQQHGQDQRRNLHDHARRGYSID